MIEEISDYLSYFARSLSLNEWDWFAFIIAIFSLTIAIFSFVIARRTLVIARRTLTSQQQTERNTTPSINRGSQYESLVSIVNQLLDNYFSSLIMNYKAKKMTGTEDFSNILLLSSKINTDDIHVELFYNNFIPGSEYEKEMKVKYGYEYNYMDRSYYRLFAEFRNHVDNYNHFCNLLELQYVNNSNKRSLIAKEYASYLKSETINLLSHIVLVSNKAYPEYDLRMAIQRRIDISYDRYFYLFSNNHTDETRVKDNDILSFFMELIDDNSWNSLFSDYMPKYDFERTSDQLKIAIADITYFIFIDGWQRDYNI